MSLSQPGAPISAVEVVDISAHGIWLLSGEEEHFLSYEEFPWFKQATVAAVLDVREELSGSFYWPQLDVDLCLESIRHPEKYPLQAKLRTV